MTIIKGNLWAELVKKLLLFLERFVVSNIRLDYFQYRSILFLFLRRASSFFSPFYYTAVAVFLSFCYSSRHFFFLLSLCVSCNSSLSFGFVGSSSESCSLTVENTNGGCTLTNSIGKMCQTTINVEANLFLKTEDKFYFKILKDFIARGKV